MIDTTQLELPEVSVAMSATQIRMLERAVDILRNLPVQFVVAAPGDRVFKRGDWELVPNKPDKPKREFKYAYGLVREYIRPYIDNLKPGDVVNIPIGEFDVDSIQSNASSYAVKLFGKGSYTSTRGEDRAHIEFYRAV